MKTDAAAAAVTVWMTSAAKIPVPRPAEAPADDAPVDEVPDEPVEVAVESVPEPAAHPARPRTPSPSIESTAPVSYTHLDVYKRQVLVTVDRQRILQLLTNLLTNALRHTPAGGTVRVDAQTSGEHVELTVTDTGDGISATHLPHVFERFYRGDTARDREHGGSGIGLAIARGIAHAHRGTLTAYSACLLYTSRCV